MAVIKKSKPAQKTRNTPGPKPEFWKFRGDWRDAMKKSLGKKKPVDGWPK